MIGRRATLLVVADAHNGCDAAEFAVAAVLASFGDDPPKRLTAAEAAVIISDAGVAVQRGTSHAGSERTTSRTTLALALVTSKSVCWATFGDSCVLIATGAGGQRLDTPRPAYLGYMFLSSEIGALLSTGVAVRDSGDAVVLATDGLEQAGVSRGVALPDAVASSFAAAVGADPIARRLVGDALASGVRDAVTVAVSFGDADRGSALGRP